jgi:hypothetical protein
MKHYC